MPSPRLNGSTNSALGQCKRGCARDGAALLAFFQDDLRIGPNMLFDILESCMLRASAIFGCGTDNTAGIGDKIRHNKNPAIVQHTFRFRRTGDIGALWHQPGLQSIGIVSSHHVRPSCRDPYLTLNIEDSVGPELLAARVVAKTTPFVLQGDQGPDIKTIAIDQGSATITSTRKDGAFSS